MLNPVNTLSSKHAFMFVVYYFRENI